MQRYGTSPQVFNSKHHLFATLTREISSWTLEEKFHVSLHLCIILYILYELTTETIASMFCPFPPNKYDVNRNTHKDENKSHSGFNWLPPEGADQQIQSCQRYDYRHHDPNLWEKIKCYISVVPFQGSQLRFVIGRLPVTGREKRVASPLKSNTNGDTKTWTKIILYLPVHDAYPSITRTPILDCTYKGGRKQRKWLRKAGVKKFVLTKKKGVVIISTEMPINALAIHEMISSSDGFF